MADLFKAIRGQRAKDLLNTPLDPDPDPTPELDPEAFAPSQGPDILNTPADPDPDLPYLQPGTYF